MIYISIIITTYNRKEILRDNLYFYAEYFKSNSDTEVIIADDNSIDGTAEMVRQEFPWVKFIQNKGIRGYSTNLQNAICQSRGEYFINLSDDDRLIEPQYIDDVIHLLKNDIGASMFFARQEIESGTVVARNNYNFKPIYDNISFLKEWFDFRDYIGFSTFIFQKNIFVECNAFTTTLPYVYAPDWTAILKCAILSKKIYFVDKYVYRWKNTNINQISKQHRGNMLLEVFNYISSPYEVNKLALSIGVEDQFINSWNNKEVNYLLEAIKSNYHISKSNELFNKIFQNIKFEKFNNIFIYGGGDAGAELRKFFDKELIKYEIVDDMREIHGYISFENFINKVSSNDLVIIATFKYRLLHLMYKKIRNFCDVEIIDLLQNDQFIFDINGEFSE
ncbi:glycosyltransferase family 2 protein [Arcobacter sp. FWKO B]|uniref:glycosyltransferase family 2 protein n=1 Tax=Arcobacter sp. FWKO B TaxID=2593672 RepID=UPI0018A674CC|nr:glycosyltransferase [Arcobacter sp. FWKO B]QOG12164.1 glycosyltransferase [Arcobacter sp. FWKO B]